MARVARGRIEDPMKRADGFRPEIAAEFISSSPKSCFETGMCRTAASNCNFSLIECAILPEVPFL